MKTIKFLFPLFFFTVLATFVSCDNNDEESDYGYYAQMATLTKEGRTYYLTLDENGKTYEVTDTTVIAKVGVQRFP